MQGFGMGKYRPPDSDPSKQPFNKTHPLGKRARKIDQGILVVRFELPFNIWCDGCNNHIGQGVRYNAEKRQAGEYFSTKIWAFRCKCHLCSHWFEIRTDPKNTRYVVQEGARQQKQDWDPAENGGHSIYDSDQVAGSSNTGSHDPMAVLEKRQSDKAIISKTTARILELEDHNSSRWADPYTLNSRLRDGFRREKRQRTKQLEADLALRKRIGWNQDRPLLAPSATDGESWQKERLEAERQRLMKPTSVPSNSRHKTSSSTSNSNKANKSKAQVVNDLRNRILDNTRKKRDPFLGQLSKTLAKPK